MTFTTDQVTKGISSCSNTRAFGPDKISIFHLKHFGSRAIEYLTTIFNDSVTSCRFRLFRSHPLSSQSRNQARTPLSALFIGPSRSPAHQRKLWRLSYIAPPTTASFRIPTRFPARTLYHFCFATTKGNLHVVVCVAVDLTAAFDTVNHNVLLSKIVTLPEATCRWQSNYIRGRQSVTSCRGVKSKARIVHTGVPQGCKMSPTLFSF